MPESLPQTLPETSPRLALPYLMPAQAQKHVTHNEALRMLDALVQLRLEAFDATTPPATPAEGATYGLADSPADAWAGQGGRLAIWQEAAWQFLTPQPGWRAWVPADQALRIWDGTAWGLPPLTGDRLERLGIATDADASNRLSLRSPASLLSHDGGGHQLKINKATDSDTASLLFQSNWAGHAEMGLAGNTDFTVKLSPDGSSWDAAMVLKSANGRAGFGTYDPGARLEVQGDDSTLLALTATGSAQDYLTAGDGSGAMFRLSQNGNGYCDGAWSGGGADYAEFFEWLDGNPEGEDRRGISVVLEGDRIRAARPGETPMGVISTTPSILGNDDGGRWQGRSLRDGFGAILRDTGGAPCLNPAYDPTCPYRSRAERVEWDMVGLLGRLRLRAGQPTDPRWIRLRAVPAGKTTPPEGLEDWLIR
ncbi:DUF2793 domain-containing protein [Phaeobacter gallaeciensis]|uniref:DUF2793 domain-containing protein n=1 Tax=Phaeobacter gallaeciensis TaxID=60890 RepID=UPI000BBB946D|nr:DUF2793 domain-containing protein [Phaeobacter gallaeciensis]ATF20745.1 Protein of unknown function/Peptidase G2, IMC autoproteolytic cleavage domain protein [Phaeobacter gallaeciensis]ATF24854.1 Protein of unknown function/Peptidase G2, IMC autoproteolytic cleavage domain protein [Phaeobacter gallaeciensis]